MKGVNREIGRSMECGGRTGCMLVRLIWNGRTRVTFVLALGKVSGNEVLRVIYEGC